MAEGMRSFAALRMTYPLQAVTLSAAKGQTGSGETGHVGYDFTGLNIETLVMSGKWFRVRVPLKNMRISEAR